MISFCSGVKRAGAMASGRFLRTGSAASGESGALGAKGKIARRQNE